MSESSQHAADQLPRRPLLAGFHPDPSVCRAGDAYYLACSTFEYAPGVPIFSSPDLLDWTLIGHALDRPSRLDLASARPSGGIYAPTLRFHDDRFWMIVRNSTGAPGLLLVTATDPGGPWSEPLRIPGTGRGIDPDLAWDADGTCYLTWADLRDGVMQAELDTATGELLSEPALLWQGMGGKFPEGPHLYRVGEHWYLVLAEGGTGQGHAATVARSASPSGPFEPSPYNPLITASGSDSVVQSTGHADLVQRGDGTWAMVFLGVRPRGMFPQWHVLGRETFGASIEWRDGWPVYSEPIEPAHLEPTRREPFVEEIGAGPLPASWITPGAFPQDVSTTDPDGTVRLTASASSRVFTGRRQEHTGMVAMVQLDVPDGSRGGLELRIDPWHAVSVELAGDVVRAVARIGGLASTLGERQRLEGDVLRLETVASDALPFTTRLGPDTIVASIVRDGETVELGRLDGRYLSTEVAGGFTGRVIGVVAESGRVGIRRFRYEGWELG
ncbi:glycoside hydrolase family 43 protein [Humibacter sp. RRB41]|uniref:glycoside hydrolase family 43 protein n=1 Tax=Humibacter sp. RRB41 TaxID=2919946 RepID=UPI001FAA31AE|nr:glycoside hydrolase family 43 protein [Humibacter sp. RRB41]